jgi:hypothetical protein
MARDLVVALAALIPTVLQGQGTGSLYRNAEIEVCKVVRCGNRGIILPAPWCDHLVDRGHGRHLRISRGVQCHV